VQAPSLSSPSSQALFSFISLIILKSFGDYWWEALLFILVVITLEGWLRLCDLQTT
jgi:hypothetical protein